MLQKSSILLGRVTLAAQLYFAVAVVILLWPISVYVLLPIALAKLTKRGYRQLTSFGTARWADEKDLKRAGMLGAKSGLILGRLPDNRNFLKRLASGSSGSTNQLVRLPQAVHTVTFAPTGVGKNRSLIIPSLLTDERSAVVVDFKGENANLTAEHRQKEFGHQIVRLDPYRSTTQNPDTFNPLDFIRADDPLAIDDCNVLANSLVTRASDEKDPHWNDSAEALICALAATVVGYGEKGSRSLLSVGEIASHLPKLDMATKLMLESPLWGGALANMGGQLLHHVDKEKSSVLSTVSRHLRCFGTPVIADCIRTSSFDPRQLRDGRMTVYLILPPDRAHAQAGLLRMWIGSLLRACVRGGLQ